MGRIEQLAAALRRDRGLEVTVENLAQMAGGASSEIWRFDAVTPEGSAIPLIWRRARMEGPRRTSKFFPTIDTGLEARLMRDLHGHGVLVPEIYASLEPDDGLGPGFIMEWIAGEGNPVVTVRSPELAGAREHLTFQLGEILAQIHAMDASGYSDLAGHDVPDPARQQVGALRETLDDFDVRSAVFELALRWLQENAPEPIPNTLVHGDFRNGNLMVTEEGLNSLLDWETAHLGDPREDLGWMCISPWRYGQRGPARGWDRQPVGVLRGLRACRRSPG